MILNHFKSCNFNGERFASISRNKERSRRVKTPLKLQDIIKFAAFPIYFFYFHFIYYLLSKGGYVFGSVGWSGWLSVCLKVPLLKKL